MTEPIEFLDSTPSTNQYLADLSLKLFPGDIKAVATFIQPEGRGQRGNEWLSEPGCNVLYSLLFHPKGIHSLEQFIISQSVSLTIKSFLNEYTKDITIKWPNDIFWKNKKIAGILIENEITGNQITQSIIGIGININQQHFPPEIPNATSLRHITEVEYNLNDLTNKLHRQLCQCLSELTSDKSEDTHRFYINNLYRRDGFHRYSDKDGFFKARICGISSFGYLMLELEDKTIRTYGFKEVQFA